MREYLKGRKGLRLIVGAASLVLCACSDSAKPETTTAGPPTLAWAEQLPPVVMSSALTVKVGATSNGSTVTGVSVSLNGDAPLLAKSGGDGTYTVDLTLTPGANTITAWGQDDQGHSGQNAGAPYTLSATVALCQTDVDGPTPALVASFRSYYDERGITVVTDSAGHAVVPARYEYMAEKVPALSVGNIYKAATRLAWTTKPTAADLEGANPDNIPTLQFAIPSTNSSPVVAATYSVSVACSSGCTNDAARATLWPSPKTAPDVVYYDLPLVANLIPALASVPGPATLNIAVTAVDAAGICATTSLPPVTFHAIGPPLAVSRDAAYSQEEDPQSTYPYTRSANNYGALFDSSNNTFGSAGGVRLERHVVTNPATEPVALSVPVVVNGAWSVSETWSLQVASAVGLQELYPANTTAAGPQYLCALGSSGSSLPVPAPCAWASSCDGSKYVWRPTAGTLTGEQCGVQVSPVSGTIASDTPTATADATTVLTSVGRLVVPASDGVMPGSLNVYILRPHSVTRSVPVSATGPWTYSAGEQLTEEDPSTSVIGCRYLSSCYRVQPASRSLQAAAETWAGSWTPETWGLYGNSEMGEPSSGTAIDFNAGASH